MIAASFYTLFYWTVFGAVAVYLLLLVMREADRRARVRRMRERRLRRNTLNQLEPRRWTT
jgi:hypothetical protein